MSRFFYMTLNNDFDIAIAVQVSDVARWPLVNLNRITIKTKSMPVLSLSFHKH